MIDSHIFEKIIEQYMLKYGVPIYTPILYASCEHYISHKFKNITISLWHDKACNKNYTKLYYGCCSDCYRFEWVKTLDVFNSILTLREIDNEENFVQILMDTVTDRYFAIKYNLK